MPVCKFYLCVLMSAQCRIQVGNGCSRALLNRHRVAQDVVDRHEESAIAAPRVLQLCKMVTNLRTYGTCHCHAAIGSFRGHLPLKCAGCAIRLPFCKNHGKDSPEKGRDVDLSELCSRQLAWSLKGGHTNHHRHGVYPPSCTTPAICRHAKLPCRSCRRTTLRRVLLYSLFSPANDNGLSTNVPRCHVCSLVLLADWSPVCPVRSWKRQKTGRTVWMTSWSGSARKRASSRSTPSALHDEAAAAGSEGWIGG